jgi:hypothetical protein
MARKPARGDGDQSHKSSPAKTRSPKNDELLWLETYFIVFPRDRRPTLAQVEHALAEADPRLKLENLAADDDGLFASLLVQSPEDHAAVEVSYEVGDAVVEQNLDWAKHLQKQLSSQHLQQMMTADARLDVAHFERVQAGALRPKGPAAKSKPPHVHDEFGGRFSEGSFSEESEFGGNAFASDDDDFDEEAALEIFDPTCLLTVVETLSKLTHGLAFDPAAGEVV